MKLLGIDFGAKRVGLAVGDDGARVAVPFLVIPGGEDVVARILDIAGKEGIEGFVVGVAIPEEYQREDQVERTMAFVALLKKGSPRPVHLVDEQFTSAEARRVRAESGAQVAEDALAAMLILQAYLDEAA